MRKSLLLACVIVVLFGSLTACNDDKNDDKPVVHGVLFYSPSCGHCHKVMTEDLPPLSRKYGRQLVILEVDTATEQGQALFYAALDYFEIDSAGVPLMAVGDVVLRGSVEIPEQLPGMIEAGLASGGIDWPAIPGFVPPGD
jgi:thiol-disulfide isomerase/thioredoxin